MLLLIGIGLIAGIASGLFGIGGGVLIVPGLIYLAGYAPTTAVGTSLASLLPPVTLGAVLEYYGHGHVRLKSVLFIVPALLLGAWLGALMANRINGNYLRLLFGAFIVGLGTYMVIESVKKIVA